MLGQRRAVFFVEMNDRLGVGSGVEMVTPGGQRFAKLAIVVDLSIQDTPNRAFFVMDRLVTGFEVNDLQSGDADRCRPVGVNSPVVWPAMVECPHHRLGVASLGRFAIEV